MTDMIADAELAKKGDSEAFARLYSTVYKDMYHIALYSLRSTHDAADAVSDTVIDAFCSIKKLRDAGNFRSWIMTILAAKIKRKQREYFRNEDTLSETLPDITDFSYDSAELNEALDRLGSESRLMLSMSVLGGYTSGEIAELCGMKVSTVRSRLSRIKQQLRIALSDEGAVCERQAKGEWL